MYPQTQNKIDFIDLMQQTKNFLEHYISNREAVITQREREIANLKQKCEETARRTELLKQFSDQFFEERQKVRQISIEALDQAIEYGDEEIAAIALSILGKEYSKDFFGMINKI